MKKTNVHLFRSVWWSWGNGGEKLPAGKVFFTKGKRSEQLLIRNKKWVGRRSCVLTRRLISDYVSSVKLSPLCLLGFFSVSHRLVPPWFCLIMRLISNCVSSMASSHLSSYYVSFITPRRLVYSVGVVRFVSPSHFYSGHSKYVHTNLSFLAESWKDVN